MNFSCLVDIKTKILCPARKLTRQDSQKKVALINKMAKRDSVPKSARQDGSRSTKKREKWAREEKKALHKADFPFLIFLSPTTTLKMRARLKDECAARL
jgi:hypothetical protein